MSDTRRFICSRPVSSTSPCNSFEKDIPLSLVDRSDFLKLALSDVADGESPVPLVLPREIDSECVDAWLLLNESAALPAPIDAHEVERTPPEVLLQALRVRPPCSSLADIFASLLSSSSPEGFECGKARVTNSNTDEFDRFGRLALLLQVADFLADDIALDTCYRLVACHLFCPSHSQRPSSPQPRKRQKLSRSHESDIYKRLSRPVQKQRSANKKVCTAQSVKPFSDTGPQPYSSKQFMLSTCLFSRLEMPLFFLEPYNMAP